MNRLRPFRLVGRVPGLAEGPQRRAVGRLDVSVDPPGAGEPKQPLGAQREDARAVPVAASGTGQADRDGRVFAPDAVPELADGAPGGPFDRQVEQAVGVASVALEPLHVSFPGDVFAGEGHLPDFGVVGPFPDQPAVVPPDRAQVQRAADPARGQVGADPLGPPPVYRLPSAPGQLRPQGLRPAEPRQLIRDHT